MKKSNFALRLQPSLMDEARKLAHTQGVAVNQLINVAVAEKVSALRTEEYFAERAGRSDPAKALRILKRAGFGQPPMAGDELLMDKRVRPIKTAKPTKPATSIDEQLRFAIAYKRLIQVTYDGHARVLEPHDYGIQKRVPRLLAFQVRGGSAHANNGGRGWKLLKVSKIESCVVLDETFHGSRALSNQDHLAWDQVFARVDDIP